MRRFVEKKVEMGKIWPLIISVDLTFELTKANHRNSFIIIFYSLLNAAYRVSLPSPEAELDGAVQTFQ